MYNCEGGGDSENDQSFFSFLISPEKKHSKTSKVKQQSVLNL